MDSGISSVEETLPLSSNTTFIITGAVGTPVFYTSGSFVSRTKIQINGSTSARRIRWLTIA